MLNGLHDAEILGVEIDRHKKSITVRLDLREAKQITIKMEGVSHFRAVDLIMQNVISRVLASEIDTMTSEYARRRISWVTSLSDGASFADDEGISAIEHRISAGEMVLLVFEPSWGAEMVVIAKSYSVDQI